jgi:F0F1-type ATP synthase assembly protein I
MPPTEPDPFEKLKAELEAIDPDDPEMARLQELADRPLTRTEAPQIDDDGLAAIQARADATRSRLQAQNQERERRLGQDRDAARGLGVGLAAAYAMVGLPLAGVAVGYLLDKPTGGTFWKAALTLLGAIVGIWFAAVQVNREK